MNGICCVLNFAPHYRSEVYLLMEKELGCTFYFGNDTISHNLRKVDYSLFSKRPSELKFVRILGNLNWLKGSVQLCFSRKYQKFIITGEPFCLSSWVLMALCKFLGKPTFVWTHGFYGRESGIRKWIKWLYFKLPSGYFLYGNYGKKMMIELGFDASSISVIYNSLSYARQMAIKPFLTHSDINDCLFSKKLPIIIFIGRITVQKKLDLIVNLLSNAQNMNIRLFNFLIIGDGNYLPTLKALAKKCKIEDHIHFLGACYDENEVAQRIYNSDLCVSPGEVGLTGIHALTFGTPVITHNNFSSQMPEFEAIIPGETGDFFQENDSEDLYKVIIKWLDNNPVKDEKLVQNCFSIINNFYNPVFQISQMKAILNLY